MRMIKKIESENIANHYYIVTMDNVNYMRTKLVATGEITWDITMEQTDKYDPFHDEVHDNELERHFNTALRLFKLERILSDD